MAAENQFGLRKNSKKSLLVPADICSNFQKKLSAGVPRGGVERMMSVSYTPEDIKACLDGTASSSLPAAIDETVKDPDLDTCYPGVNAFQQTRPVCSCEKISEHLITPKSFIKLLELARLPEVSSNPVVIYGQDTDALVRHTFFIVNQELPEILIAQSKTLYRILVDITLEDTLPFASEITRAERLMKGESVKNNAIAKEKIIAADLKYSTSSGLPLTAELLITRLTDIHRDLYVPNTQVQVENPDLAPGRIRTVSPVQIGASRFTIPSGLCKPDYRRKRDDTDPPMMFLQPPEIQPSLLHFFGDMIADLSVNPDNLLIWAARSLMFITAVHPFVDGNGRSSRLFVDSIFYDLKVMPCILEADLLAIFPRIDAALQPSPIAVLNMVLESCANTANIVQDSWLKSHPQTPFQKKLVPIVEEDPACDAEICECCVDVSDVYIE